MVDLPNPARLTKWHVYRARDPTPHRGEKHEKFAIFLGYMPSKLADAPRQPRFFFINSRKKSGRRASEFCLPVSPQQAPFLRYDSWIDTSAAPRVTELIKDLGPLAPVLVAAIKRTVKQHRLLPDSIIAVIHETPSAEGT